MSMSLTIAGCSNLVAIGSKPFSRRLKSRCASLELKASVGVLRKSSRASHGSLPALMAFLNSCLTVFIEFSTFPLHCG